MIGIAERLTRMDEPTKLRLAAALAATGGSETSDRRTELIAKRNSLLELAKDAA